MSEYLDNYLKILPSYEADNLKRFIESEMIKIAYIGESEFQSIIEKLANFSDMVTEFTAQVPNVDKVSREQFNTYFFSVYTDLLRLYRESDLLENAILNYDYFHQAELDALQKEINALAKHIDEIELRSKVKEKMLAYIDDFSSDKTTEIENTHMYKDRNGQPRPKAEITRHNNTNRLIITTIERKSLLFDEAKKLTAIISADNEYKRGVPLPKDNHLIEEAIDNELTTYWAETVHSKEEINVSISEGEYTIPGGGAIARVLLQLNKIGRLTEIVIHPFSIYPVTIAGIFYRTPEDKIKPIIIPESPLVVEKGSAMISFNAVYTNEVMIYLKQSNYKKQNITQGSIGIGSSQDLIEETLGSPYEVYDTEISQALVDKFWEIKRGVMNEKREYNTAYEVQSGTVFSVVVEDTFTS